MLDIELSDVSEDACRAFYAEDRMTFSMRCCLTCQKMLPIGLSGLLQPVVREEWDLLIPEEIPDPAVGDGEFLIREVGRGLLLAPADEPRLAAGVAVPLAGQGHNLGLQGLADGLEAERNEGLD
jgi:hypothetical protein